MLRDIPDGRYLFIMAFIGAWATDIFAYFTGVFFEDLKRLNIERPELTPKATEHIDQMIEFVEELCAKGYGYETSDGIYFDISK